MTRTIIMTPFQDGICILAHTRCPRNTGVHKAPTTTSLVFAFPLASDMDMRRKEEGGHGIAFQARHSHMGAIQNR